MTHQNGERVSDPDRPLVNAPIVEAVVDLDCVMPPGLDIAALETPARDAFAYRYPKVRTLYLEEAQIEQRADAPPQVTARRGIQGYQFWQEDEKQLVQVRAQGFSFNRLAPYTSLDDYLSEIERTWRLFVGLVSPVEVQLVRLRYINRILLPTVDGRVELNNYLKMGPRLPDEERLTLLEFLDQHLAVERATGNQVNVILTSQPLESSMLPIIFDIAASRAQSIPPEDWNSLLAGIRSLRDLKNRVFRQSLTEQCLDLFR
jgi:uncharacterized protein (TIGR04255 family)